MQHSALIKGLCSLSILVLISSACSDDKTRGAQGKKVEADEVSPLKTFTSPPGYDLNKPVVTKLPDKLNEISGIVYYPKDNSLFAIVDEFGVLYKIFLNEANDKPLIQQWRFAKTGDYEDLVLHDSSFYAIKSKGDVIQFKFVSSDSIQSKEYDIPQDSAGKSEFEILYYDEQSNKLILVCKDCASDKKETVSSYAFNIATNGFEPGHLKIETAPLADQLQMEEIKFKPSAAAVHPITKELYIISSVNKCLVIADTKGVVKKAYPLDPKIYKQPEGITFTPQGDMYISNEFADEGLPNLLLFKYNKR